MGSDNRVRQGTEREMEGRFADVCMFRQVVWEMKKEELKASIHNQNYRLAGITYNGITHMTGKLTLNIFRNSKQGKRKSVQKQTGYIAGRLHKTA